MLIPIRYRCSFTILDTFKPPEYLGSTWRGALGHALRRLVCLMAPRTICVECALRQSCIYPLFYDKPLLPSIFAPEKMQDPPRPFVLEPEPAPMIFRPGEAIHLSFVLFGETANWLSNLVASLSHLSIRGLGKYQSRIRLEGVWQQDNIDLSRWHCILVDDKLQSFPVQAISIPPVPDKVRMELLSPLRLRREGQYLHPNTFTFNDVAQQLYRRLILLNNLYGDSTRENHYPPLEPIHAERSRELQWVDHYRLSARQQQKVPMGGLGGYLLLDGPALAPIWDFLWLGQWFHVGNGTTLGLGQYQLSIDT